MSVSFEMNGLLARLLAEEKIIVQHKKVDEPFYDLQNRCLTLPIWSNATENVYKAMVLHEISHAIWTPLDEWKKMINGNYNGIPSNIIMVMEDIRVENLCKLKYPGTPRIFNLGYAEIYGMEQFMLSMEPQKYNFLDRLCLYFKGNNIFGIKFSKEEKSIVEATKKMTSFKEMITLSGVVYVQCMKNMRNLDKTPRYSYNGYDGGAGNFYNPGLYTKDNTLKTPQNRSSIPLVNHDLDYGLNYERSVAPEEKTFEIMELEEELNNAINPFSIDDFEDFDESDESDETEEWDDGIDFDISSDFCPEQEIKKYYDDDEYIESARDKIISYVLQSLQDCSRVLTNTNSDKTYEYIEIPQIDSNVIIPPDIYYAPLKEKFVEYPNIEQRYQEFKSNSKKDVNYMVKEFETKKSARLYSKIKESKTGVLDCDKLHSYLYNDDIFKRNLIVKEGKSHGLVIFLDWSGSMSKVIESTVKQLYKILWFCRRQNIPFKVYTFGQSSTNYHYQDAPVDRLDNKMFISHDFTLCEIFNSETKSYEFEEQLKLFYYLASRVLNSGYPMHCMGWTPLYESLLTLNTIIPQFKKKYNVQKLNCIVLTDGEPNELRYIRHDKKYHQTSVEYTYADIICSNVNRDVYLIDPKTKETHFLSYLGNRYSSYTESQLNAILNVVRSNNPDLSISAIRILESRDLGSFISRFIAYDDAELRGEVRSKWEAERWFVIENGAFDKFFAVSEKLLYNTVFPKFNKDDTKSVITKKFKLMMKIKTMNNKFLSDFIGMIS